MRIPSSRASAQSCFATSGVTLPGWRAAIASVMRPSSEEKYVSRIRRMSSGWFSSLYDHHSPPVGIPCAYTARIPASFRPWMAASEWSGVLLMCDQSSKVVTPAFNASSEPA